MPKNIDEFHNRMVKDIMNFNFDGNVDRIGNDVILMENPFYRDGYEFPFSSECIQCVVITSGSMQCTIDLQDYEINSTGLIFVLPGRIVQKIRFCDGFKGYFIVMSGEFTQSLGLSNEYELFRSISDNAFTPMAEESVKAILNYIYMIQGIMRQSDNPNRLEIVRHLTIAYNLGMGYYIHKHSTSSVSPATPATQLICDRFLKSARRNCRSHRELSFYADEQCISPKYLTTVVKNVSGRSAMKWIEEYTVLNAKMLLRTTNMTVGQVSDELNFSTQSDFGKYFKHITGMSPRLFKTGGGAPVSLEA